MSRTVKIILGLFIIFTFAVPMALLAVSFVKTLMLSPDEIFALNARYHRVAMMLSFFWAISLYCSAFFYIIHMHKSGSVPQEKRRFWMLMLIFGSTIATPVYWYQVIWKEGSPNLGQLEALLDKRIKFL